MLYLFLTIALLLLGSPFLFILAYTCQRQTFRRMDKREIDKYYDKLGRN